MRERKWPDGPWWWDDDFPENGMSFEAPALEAYFQEHAPWLFTGDGETAVLKGEVMTTPDIARLLAAAPELAEALEALYKAHCDGKYTLADRDYRLITQAAFVLAKAYGESDE